MPPAAPTHTLYPAAVEAPGWSGLSPHNSAPPPQTCGQDGALGRGSGEVPPRLHASAENEQGPARGACAHQSPEWSTRPPQRPSSCPRTPKGPGRSSPGRVSSADARIDPPPRGALPRVGPGGRGTSPPASASARACRDRPGLSPQTAHLARLRSRSTPPPRPSSSQAAGYGPSPATSRRAPGGSGSGAKSRRGALSTSDDNIDSNLALSAAVKAQW